MLIQRNVWRGRYAELGSFHIWIGTLVLYGVIAETEAQRANRRRRVSVEFSRPFSWRYRLVGDCNPITTVKKPRMQSSYPISDIFNNVAQKRKGGVTAVS